MNPVAEIRRVGDLTQAELAERGGTSQPTIAAYESGRTSPTLRTLRRLAGAAGLEVAMQFVPTMTREDRRSLAWHREISRKLIEDGDSVMAKARVNVEIMLDANPGAAPLLLAWKQILRGPVSAILAILADSGVAARESRAVTPFAGVLSARERRDVLLAFRDQEYRDES